MGARTVGWAPMPNGGAAAVMPPDIWLASARARASAALWGALRPSTCAGAWARRPGMAAPMAPCLPKRAARSLARSTGVRFDGRPPWSVAAFKVPMFKGDGGGFFRRRAVPPLSSLALATNALAGGGPRGVGTARPLGSLALVANALAGGGPRPSGVES